MCLNRIQIPVQERDEKCVLNHSVSYETLLSVPGQCYLGQRKKKKAVEVPLGYLLGCWKVEIRWGRATYLCSSAFCPHFLSFLYNPSCN